jgi:hypothetical protein
LKKCIASSQPIVAERWTDQAIRDINTADPRSAATIVVERDDKGKRLSKLVADISLLSMEAMASRPSRFDCDVKSMGGRVAEL